MNGIAPAIRTQRMNNKLARQFINLGALGDEVEVEAWYDVLLDDDGDPIIDLRAVYIVGKRDVIQPNLCVRSYLYANVLHDLEEAAKEQEGFEE